MEFRYNYIILGSDGYYRIGYQDVINLANVNYYVHYSDGLNFLNKKLAKLTFSKKVNNFIRHPFASIVFPRVFKSIFPSDKPICLLAFSTYYYLLDTEYFSWFKQKYPTSKLVMYYQDKVHVHTPNVDFDRLKKVFDVIYSYDKQDCKQYGLDYYPTPYSKYVIIDDKTLPKSDIFFCGKAKTRYITILEAYEKFKRMGLDCDFYLSSFPTENTRPGGVHYNERLTYAQYLQHLSRSNCLLEVQQEGADGYTPRLWESIIFDKHLITNNDAVFKSPFYNPSFHHKLDMVLSDTEELRRIATTPAYYSVKEKETLSPINFLLNIEQHLA